MNRVQKRAFLRGCKGTAMVRYDMIILKMNVYCYVSMWKKFQNNSSILSKVIEL